MDNFPPENTAGDLSFYLNFFKSLQAVTNKIHATDNLDQIMLDVSADLCQLFACDRLTVYAVSAGKTYIESKIKTGLNSFRDFTVPISSKSIAGYVAMTKTSVNIADVYDQDELGRYSPALEFMDKVDKRTGYRTRQMLAGPLVDTVNGDLLGVVQMMNTRSGQVFSSLMEEGMKDLCQTLSIAFAKRMKPAIRSRYDGLVAKRILSAAELELATRSARRKHDDIEAILINQFQVGLAHIGEALASFYGMTYEPYREERACPDALLKNFKREFVEQSQWLPLEEIDGGVIVMTTDPDRIRGSRIVQNLFPHTNLIFRVTTGRDFRRTVDRFFGASQTGDNMPADSAPLASGSGVEHNLTERVCRLIRQAFAQQAQDISIKLTVSKPAAGLQDEAGRARVGGQLVMDFDTSHS